MQVDVGDVMFAATPSLVPKLAARVCELQAEVDSRKRERRVRHRAMDAARRGDWLRIAVRVLCAWERVGQEPSRHALECEIARYSLIGDTTMLGIWVAKFLDKAIDLH